MKKFWNLMLAALVVLGAVACSEKSENLDSAPQQGLSFEATIDLAETRTDVVFNEGTGKWDTVWTGDETLSVKSGWTVYDFKNSSENKNRFVCTNDAAKDLVGKQVEIFLTHDADYNTLNSKAGKAGGKIKATVESFNPAEDVNLQVESAFLRYSSAYEVTLDASAYIFDYNGNVHNTITLPAGNDVWVAIDTADEVTLSYSINGEKCKEKTLNLAAKKIYNLGELGLPAPAFSVGLVGLGGNWDVDVDMTLEGDFYTLKNVALTANDTFKVRINDTWDENYGVASSAEGEDVAINYNAVYTLVANGKNMQVVEGAYDIYFNYETKEFYVLTAGKTPADVTSAQYKVYVYNYQTNWSSVYLYMWDASETYVFGAWPGATTSTKETINGYEYMVWTIPAKFNGLSVSMILNNNSGSQTSDFNLGVINEDKYVILNSGIADFIKDANNPEPEIPVETYKIYVYKYNNTWSTVNLYSWDATTNAQYTGGWPGTKTTVTEVINGYTYYVWEMPAAATGRQIRMIFNNGSAQTGDSDPYTLDKDLYIRLNGAAIQEIDDINNPEPTVVAQPRKVYATTTLSWSKMNIYAWGGGASFSWPGTQMSTETINGTKYYVYTFDASFDGATLSGVIFNNGSSQTIDITNVKLDQDRFFRVLTTQSSGKYKYEAIADPR